MDLPYRHPTRSWELGIDFGSTFSAVAYCLTSDSIEFGCKAGDVCSITSYPRRQGDKSLNFVRSEVPTKVRYEQEGRYKRWGWDVVYHQDNGLYRTIPGHLLELFKSGLDDHESSLEARNSLSESLSQLPFQKSVDDVVFDYLTKLLKHAKTRLEAIGYHEGDNVHLTCTVPAMWSIRAKRRTINAAEKARREVGFSLGKSVSLCSEPEAATAYVFHKFENIKLREGDTFIVCDAGGVTMDVVTYVCISKNPLRLKEVVKGQGDFCGSSNLDKRFQAQIEERLKDETYLHSIPNSKPLGKLIEAAVREFELNIKRRYPTTEDYEVGEDLDDGTLPFAYVTIPGLDRNEEKGFGVGGDMAIYRDQLEAVFLPVLKQGWNLVQSQILKAYQEKCEPTRLLIVGGFGGSNRLQRFIKERCYTLTSQLQRRPINVIVPPIPENAIAEGAIYRTLKESMVEDLVSRSSICITRHDPFDGRQKAHKGAEAVNDELEGRKYVHDCVEILLKTDQMIPSTGLKKVVALHRTIKSDEKVLELTIPIWVMDEGNGTDSYPLSHSSNKGYELLETVRFKVDVEPIKGKLKRYKYGTSLPIEQSIPPKRKPSNIRTRKMTSGKKDQPTATRSTRPESGNDHLRRSRTTSPSEGDANPDGGQDPASFYYWVDFQLEVEFKDGLMAYHLMIKNVDRSYKGEVNLISIVKPFDLHDEA